MIASLVGTHEVLDEDDRSRIKGFVINKFRGDAGLFADAGNMYQRRVAGGSAYAIAALGPLELSDFIGKPVSMQVESLYTQEQYDIVLM